MLPFLILGCLDPYLQHLLIEVSWLPGPLGEALSALVRALSEQSIEEMQNAASSPFPQYQCGRQL